VLHKTGPDRLKPSIKCKNQALVNLHSGAGFTLLEILIAIFIFSIVVTTIFVSYNLERMIFDLKSVYVTLPPRYTSPGFDDPEDPYRINADTINIKNNDFPRLRFASLAHLALRGKIEEGIAEVIYYVQDSEDRGYILRRADSLYPYSPFEEKNSDPILCEGIKTLTFKFYDQEGTEYDLWDSDAKDFGFATPTSIGIKLELGNDTDAQLFETRVTLPVQRKKKK
jgi:general secretion pathway protein J